MTGAGVTLTIDNATSFTNSGTLLATAGGELLLINDTVTDASGKVEVDANSTLDLQTTTVNNGTVVNSGLLEATVGANTIHAAASITNNSGATLEVTGAGVTLTIDNATSFTNSGTITVETAGALTLSGDGTVDNSGGAITVAGTGTLTVTSTTIEDGSVTVAASGGTLDLESATINGGTVCNSGIIEVAAGSSATITGDIHGTGSLEIGSGATLEFGGRSTSTVTFEGSSGTLQIDSAGTSTPYSIYGGGGHLPDGDQIYLPNISFDAAADSYNAQSGVITVGNGNGHTVTIDVVGGIGSDDTFVFAQEGSGTVIYDPLASLGTGPGSGLVSIGGPGNDQFVFHPGIGADTIVNFNPQADTIELDHFANIQTIQELASLITTDAHGDAVIDLGHHDSITLPGMNAAQLQAVLQSVVHLH